MLTRIPASIINGGARRSQFNRLGDVVTQTISYLKAQIYKTAACS
jgi:hypothetical protein